MRSQQDQQSKLLYELSTLIFNILRSPTTPFEFSDQSPVIQRSTQLPTVRPMQQITPAGFASLLLGISMALMLCGSVTFFIGFFMMPWIIVFVMLLYLAGIVSVLSMIGRAIFCPMSSSQSHSQPCKILWNNLNNCTGTEQRWGVWSYSLLDAVSCNV